MTKARIEKLSKQLVDLVQVQCSDCKFANADFLNDNLPKNHYICENKKVQRLMNSRIVHAEFGCIYGEREAEE